MKTFRIGDTRLEVIKGDITKCQADIIVNAANTSLLGGGGVDGAIHRAGGQDILAECMEIRNKQGGCAVGEAVYTTAGRLPARYVIHTVGPVWNKGEQNERQLLGSCYLNTMELAHKLQGRSIAFPNISTGIYRFPKELAADIALQAVAGFLQQRTGLEEIIFVCYDDENYNLYLNRLQADAYKECSGNDPLS
ncbi:O-acetyl-ADP-ribose deacetylase [Paenibacillus sp. P46E]|uniref:O-acetyl-ADP-ribose deacetylase n=1 Tax=Paenibacillus sp. P46E TaxID=1349436 RepID=UPI00093B3154|nr:O-acetyl-ADP-ribose deacetylase [Paenibacillus sp. P46E]OKP95505.1 RNase III inhibitor [Paenibacillus sp. P46E]